MIFLEISPKSIWFLSGQGVLNGKIRYFKIYVQMEREAIKKTSFWIRLNNINIDTKIIRSNVITASQQVLCSYWTYKVEFLKMSDSCSTDVSHISTLMKNKIQGSPQCCVFIAGLEKQSKMGRWISGILHGW